MCPHSARSVVNHSLSTEYWAVVDHEVPLSATRFTWPTYIQHIDTYSDSTHLIIAYVSTVTPE